MPHAWLGRDTHDISTFDLGGYDRFALLTGADSEAWEQAAATVSVAFDVPIPVHAVALGQRDNDVLGE